MQLASAWHVCKVCTSLDVFVGCKNVVRSWHPSERPPSQQVGLPAFVSSEGIFMSSFGGEAQESCADSP